jgi:tetratricopeptide (TPR) repeat protein
VRSGLAQARRVGNRYWELSFLGQLYPFLSLGEWDEALAMFAELPIDEWAGSRQAFSVAPLLLATVLGHRGALDELRHYLQRFEEMGGSGDEQERSAYRSGLARYLLAGGNHAEALVAAEEALASHVHFGFGAEQIKEAFAAACEAAHGLGDHAKLGELVGMVDSLPPGATNLFLRAQSAHYRAHLARAASPAEADELFRLSAALLADLAAPFTLAVVRTEHAEMLLAEGTAGDASGLLAEARSVFERLGATTWLERRERLGVEAGATA